MAIWRRRRIADVLLLTPVRLGDEKVPRGKVRLLYCDAEGRVFADLMSRAVYQRAREDTARLARSRKPYATLGRATGGGSYTPAAVEIGTEQAWALERIMEHALKTGRLPDILKKYLKPIITQAGPEAAPAGKTPPVLNRLPYYPEHEMEFSLPLYKADYRYPLIVLKELPAGRPAAKNPPRLLILDSDGDLAAIKVPSPLAGSISAGLRSQSRKGQKSVCALITQRQGSMVVDYMTVSQAQRKALDTMTRYYEETGNGKQPVSAATRAVLVKAMDKTFLPGT